MPLIDDYTLGKKKHFKKKPYRPWNLLDELESPSPSTNKKEDKQPQKLGASSQDNKGTIGGQLGDNKENKVLLHLSAESPGHNSLSSSIGLPYEKPLLNKVTISSQSGDELQKITADECTLNPAEPFSSETKKVDTPSSSPEPLPNKGTIRGQLGDNKGTNWGTNKGTIGGQLGDINNVALPNKGTIRGQLGDNKGTNWGTNKGTIGGQLGDINDQYQIVHNEIEYLRGCQREILFFIANHCFANGTLTSKTISKEILQKALNLKGETVKTSLKRLVKKGFIKRVDGKRGVGGFTRFKLTELVRNVAVEKSKQPTIGDELGDNKGTNWGTNWGTNASSSSSINNNNYNIGQEKAEWEELDLKELHKQGVHLTLHQLAGVWGKIQHHSVFEVQESLDAFAYDIQHKHVEAKHGPIRFLMGIMHKGNVYCSARYESPERKQMKAILALAEQRKAEEKALQEALEDKVFMEWLNEPGRREKVKDILPISLLVDFDVGGEESKAWLKYHFSSLQKRI